MKHDLFIENRSIEHASLVIEENLTLREVANRTMYSKSTVHKDLKERLPKINSFMYLQVKEILEQHWKERSMRGGEATKKKYKKFL